MLAITTVARPSMLRRRWVDGNLLGGAPSGRNCQGVFGVLEC
jgi:hypothetical protein